MKIAINKCYGGFSLSKEAAVRYNARHPDGSLVYRPTTRNDPRLIDLIEEMGEAAFGDCADIKIVGVPDDVDWYIEEYDGNEWVAERHRTWS